MTIFFNNLTDHRICATVEIFTPRANNYYLQRIKHFIISIAKTLPKQEVGGCNV